MTIADFSTLYTSFEHDIILDKLFFILELLFKHAHKDYISVRYDQTAYYHSNASSKATKYTLQDVFAMARFIVQNSYVKFAGELFHQDRGLPMGGNASVRLSDLVLISMEYQYLMKNPASASRLRHTFRYIDDLLTLNTAHMRDASKDIYPPSLPLNFEDIPYNGHGHYLDLDINSSNGQCNLYDKRKDFSFNVIRLGCADSNCPRELYLNAMFSQLLRYGRICSEKDEFKKAAFELFLLMKNNGYRPNDMENTVYKMLMRYPAVLRKFDLRSKKQIKAWIKE
jgi:hypothetical protein